MAEKDKKTEKSVEQITNTKASKADSSRKAKLLLIGGGVVLGALIVLLVVLAAVVIKGAKYSDGDHGPHVMRSHGGMKMDRSGDGMRGKKMRGGYDSNTMVHGTVTEVSDTEITVVGNGISKKVAVNASTTYGDKKPSANDSVMIRGTTSGDTFTATSVKVVNR